MRRLPGDAQRRTDPGFAARLANLVSALHAAPDLNETVRAVLDYVPGATGCDAAGLVLVGARRRVELAVADDERVGRVDALQFELGEGPGFAVMEEGGAPVVDDCIQEGRWRHWARSTAELGFRSATSVRLEATRPFGALTLYGRRPSQFGQESLEAAGLVGRHASVALADARRHATLRQAVDARHHIGQAQGILMEKYGLGAEQAFAVLQRYSQDNNIKVRRVAAHVIATRSLPGYAVSPH